MTEKMAQVCYRYVFRLATQDGVHRTVVEKDRVRTASLQP